MKYQSKALFSIPEWKKISFLVHGFGNRYWKQTDMEKHPMLKNFKSLFLRQIHSDILHVIEDVPDAVLAGDALLTRRQGILLVIKTADCLPILVVDRNRRAVAAVHGGWKSTSQKLAQKVVSALEEHFGCDPSSLSAALGPCIGKDCYEIGADVWKKFEDKGLNGKAFVPHPSKRGKFFLDLRLANKLQLMAAGVEDANICAVDLCTHCRTDLFSYRRSRHTKGRMLSFIGIMPS